MKQLKIEHLSPYLPYGLKINTIENKLISIDIDNKKLESKFRGHLINIYEWDEIKPILRPLSDLSKEIEHNGEKFIPSEVLNTDFTGVRAETLKFAQFNIVQKLLEWHFDVFGLIEQGLAIEK